MAVPSGHPELEEATAEDVQPSADPLLCRDLEDGQSFDLGGYSAEFYAIPGHTPGSMAVLFPEEEILLTGDACCAATLLNFTYSSSVEEYREALLALRSKLAGRYGKVLVSHGYHAFGPELLDSVLETCDEVLAGTDEALQMGGLDGRPCRTAHEMDFIRGRHDGKPGNIVYDPGHIRRSY